jgi:hypothetical protein
MWRTALHALLAFLALRASCLGQSHTESQARADLIHGTIVVVVSTKDGFVLAGDSRGSIGCDPAPGEFEKVFAIGKRAGIVVAGLIGSGDSDRQLRATIAKVLHSADEAARNYGDRQPQATIAISEFVRGVQEEMTLLDDSLHLQSSPIAAASAVSVSDKGIPEWITLELVPVHLNYAPDDERWDVKIARFIDPPESKVAALGAGTGVVQQLLNLDGPDPTIIDSSNDIMTRYYSLKREHRLAELTLSDGKALAPLLVKAAISYANSHPNECLGIGGEIQALAVTKEGPEWFMSLDRSKLPPPEPNFIVRVGHSDMYGRLDGVQWLRGDVPEGAILRFDGDLDVRIIQARFAGKCTFLLSEAAERKMPETANRLKSVLGSHCEVYRETNNGREQVSTPPPTSSHHESEGHPYSSLCNSELKSKEREFSISLRDFLRLNPGRDAFAEYLTETRLNNEERMVRDTERSLQEIDHWKQFTSDYETKYVPTAIALRRELIERVPLPARVGVDAGQKGSSTDQIYGVVHDLDTLAKELPADRDGCSSRPDR